ncbi:MAG: gliding motility-associated ABC transporter substrate-binding protein GldG [Bacteroidota bacterium]
MGNKKKRIKKNNLIQLGLSLIIIFLVNIASYYLFTRFDLTSEKRYTLSKSTKNYLKKVDDVIYFKVYLEGDFPAGFKRLRMETKEMLDEFRAYNDNIQYRFINPSEGSDKKKVHSTQEQLIQKGLQPTNLQVKSADGNSQQIIFPCALVSYKDKEFPVQLLMNQIGIPSNDVLNHSIQNLEYNLINVVRKLIVREKPRIAFVEGQNELDNTRMADIMNSLSDYYAVDRVKIDGKINSLMLRGTKEKPLLNKYKALIIAKPDTVFNEKDKYFIDQFVMHGGRILWLIDPVVAEMDSLRKAPGETIGYGRDLNLDDMLFKYGVRINTNLILDLSALPIPFVTGQSGGQPQIEMVPWYYFPLVMPNLKHPIVSNLNAITFEFASTIDTVGGKGIKKTVLLTSSNYSRAINTPTRISLDIMDKKPDERIYNMPNLPVAVLLEGKFESVYQNRVPRSLINDKESFDYKEISQPTKMIVVSDGDIIKNQLEKKTGRPYPLGYDQYTNQTFGNKDFILNCIDYLCDDSGILAIRSRELKMRILDEKLIENKKFIIQFINTVFPIFLILIYGMIQWIYRRRRYMHKKHSN